MKKICCLNGSGSTDGSNFKFLKALTSTFNHKFDFHIFNDLSKFPLFTPTQLPNNYVEEFRAKLTECEAVIICTPEYSHNIPAVLKNALEWITASGELNEKPILPITFTPHSPRGEHAMKSLLPTLQALNSRVVLELQLYQNEQSFKAGKLILSEVSFGVISQALDWL